MIIADADAVNSIDIKTVLANGFSIFFIKYKTIFIHDPQVYLKILLIVLLYANDVLINLTLVDELITKAFLQSLKT